MEGGRLQCSGGSSEGCWDTSLQGQSGSISSQGHCVRACACPISVPPLCSAEVCVCVFVCGREKLVSTMDTHAQAHTHLSCVAEPEEL